jgi:DNA helicase-2/ATP-dependent DNA helicase PcrA
MLQHNQKGKSEYDVAMAELKPIQEQAVLWNESALLVLAGPGSGKTRVLTCRIATLLKMTAEKKFRILGLTFTNKAADEMRDRVSKMVPGFGDRLFLGTFHSFCADVLRQHGTHLGIKPDFRIYSNDEDRQEIMSDALRRVSSTNPNVSATDASLLTVVDRLKANLISPEDSTKHVLDPAQREKLKLAYQAYEDELRQRNALDFNSLLYYACQLFRKFPAFAKRYRTVYPYWCVDEFQDTNLAQYELLRLMAQPDFRNIFVVADDDQIIYQWNGASHKRIENFQRDFDPEIIQLPTNYRCPPEIVILANNLISHNLLRHSGKEPLQAAKAASGTPNTVRVLKFSSQEEEALGVAQDIVNLHSTHLSETVILGRTKRLLEGVTAQLNKMQVKAVISQRRDEFVSAQFVWLHCVLRQANSRRDTRNFNILCAAFSFLSGIHIDSDAIIASARSKHGDYLREWAEVIRNSAESDTLKTVASEVTSRLVQSSDYRGFVKFATPWLQSTVNSTASEDQTQSAMDYEEDKRAWTDIYQQITSGLGSDVPLESFLHELELRSKEPPSVPNCVTLMTIHGSKGKEFDHVYLIGLAEDVLPSFQSKNKGDKSPEMEEERRNCFVGLTRTEQTLTLTFAESYYGWQKPPSRFLNEMGITFQT